MVGTGGKRSQSDQLNERSCIFLTMMMGYYILPIVIHHRIQKWIFGENCGVTVAVDNGRGSKLSQLCYPYTILVNLNEWMYISDNQNSRIIAMGGGSN